MKPRLFTLAAALSLLLCLATMALWVRSYWTTQSIKWFGSDAGFVLGAGNGIVATMFGPNYNGPDAQPIRYGWQYSSRPTRSGAGYRQQLGIMKHHGPEWLGFAYHPNELVINSSPPGRVVYYSSYRIYLPHWFVAILLAIPATLWVIQRVRRARRTEANRCVACGYDLRATPDRCPECGAMPSISLHSKM